MGLSGLVRCFVAGSLLSACSLVAAAQGVRISGSVDASSAVALQGNVSPKLKAAVDLGVVPGDRALTGMSLRFTMTDAQQAALSQLLADQVNPASPRYHQWLTPEQFATQFGLAPADVAKVSQWLTDQGFTVTSAARGGTFVRFSGTAAQAQKAFGTEIHSLALNGEQHIANVSAPSLPTAIAAVTASVSGLSDFRPHAQHQVGSAQAVSSPLGSAQPQYTSSTSGAHYMAPGDFYTIYDESPLISGGITGTGVTVAVVGQSDIDLTDIAAFRSASGLPANAPTVKLYGADPGKPTNADYVEAELDVEWAGAAAPGATILYVNSTNVIDGSLTEAIDNNLAQIISVSYGDCEPDLGASQLAYYSTLLQQASAQGMAITGPSGDAGATDCDYNVTSATHGLSVDFPASSPQVTGVGATMFTEGAGNYWSATNGSYAGSAISYIPEAVWNETSVSSRIYASGGGRSVYFPKPAWQVGTGVPADYSRDVPDVSLAGGLSHDPYLICTGGKCTNGFRDSSGYVYYAGGTSVTVPAFAGLLAVVEQKVGAQLGNANPVLYALANSTYQASVFHDTTSGTNASPCTTGSTDCPTGTAIGFSAGAGYDLATGWGSVDANSLANDWKLVTAITTTTGTKASMTNLAGDANAVVAGKVINLTATVASGTSVTTPVPTGTVQFTVDSVAVGSAVAVSSTGAATYALNTTSLTAGKHTVQATYSGDATYAGSKGAFGISITAAGGPDFTLTPATATVTVTSGKVAQGLVLTVASVNGFAGNVQFTASSAQTFNGEYSFSINPVVISSTAPTGTTTLSLFAYAGKAQAVQGQPLVSAVSSASSPRQKLMLAGGVGCGLLAFLLAGRRRRLPALFVLLLLAGMTGLSGCMSNGGANGGGSNLPTTPGTYTVNVTATGTMSGVTTSHTSVVTFVVQ